MQPIIIDTPKGKRKIGPEEPVFIVAEMSGNHGQDFDKAVAIIKAAADSGVDAVKLQTYTADTITINSNKEWFRVAGVDNPESWQGKTLYELYKEAYTPWEWHAPLQKIANELGLIFFSTPFDDTAVDFLENLKIPLYKIASYEATDIPLLKKVASTHKPIIMSVGFATIGEIDYSVQVLKNNGSGPIILLHCVTSYAQTPDISSINLRTMVDLQNRFDVIIGFSDNNGGTEIPVTAAMLGASVIEKHLVLGKTSSVDSTFSLTPHDMKTMVDAIRRVEKIKGVARYGPQNAAEQYNMRFRHSLFVVKDIKKGEKLTTENIRCIRPGFGLEPKYYEMVIGRTAQTDIENGTPLSWEIISH